VTTPHKETGVDQRLHFGRKTTAAMAAYPTVKQEAIDHRSAFPGVLIWAMGRTDVLVALADLEMVGYQKPI